MVKGLDTFQKYLQSPKNQEKLRNARLYNNDKNPIHLPRQHLSLPHVPVHPAGHGQQVTPF